MVGSLAEGLLRLSQVFLFQGSEQKVDFLEASLVTGNPFTSNGTIHNATIIEIVKKQPFKPMFEKVFVMIWKISRIIYTLIFIYEWPKNKAKIEASGYYMFLKYTEQLSKLSDLKKNLLQNQKFKKTSKRFFFLTFRTQVSKLKFELILVIKSSSTTFYSCYCVEFYNRLNTQIC